MFSLARLGTVAGLFLLAQAAPASLRRVLSFRGSADLANWVANLNFGLEDASDLCSGCEVHSGFWKAWSEIADTITSKVESALSDHSDYSLVLTGHSYGAALAALAATALRNSGHSVELVSYPHFVSDGAPNLTK
ncbi:unnamed protein product [Aspergillus oryzae]|uniref:feruloyl esterase n=2 Tax=Aspergillus oryzae TaxID=5062 RepID=A0AAN4YDQ2_ASPOZ|nr:unnamed protein product [Aspergillus oryzae]GMF95062.1 unnamed protein product [Aspergillus oryzae]GMG07246.1 unnamed protein product [Aspergillus oryzae]GMG24066.1 unnamed protein product [Aspergillus oryzae]GMG46033.1 unnamed protein product [Aspergillus oryzae var. brunneus]